MVSKTIIEGSIPSTPATREIIALLGVIFFIKKIIAIYARNFPFYQARRKLQLIGLPKIFNFWEKERTRSDKHSYVSNLPSVAILDALGGTLVRRKFFEVRLDF